MTPKHELAQLIDDAMQANRWSLRDVSDRAKAHGHALSQQNISRIRNEPVVTLVAKQARGLAAGLELPISSVVSAALRSMGFTPIDEALATPEEAVRWDGRLSSRDRRIVTAVLNELRRAEERDGDGNAATNTTAADDAAEGPEMLLAKQEPAPLEEGRQPSQGDAHERLDRPPRQGRAPGR